VRALEILAAHAEAQRAALRQGLRRRRRHERLAGDLAHERVGRRRRQAEQRGVAKEFTPIDQVIGELALQSGDENVLVSLAHGSASRRPAGRRQVSAGVAVLSTAPAQARRG
jgi:hypothetical protein